MTSAVLTPGTHTDLELEQTLAAAEDANAAGSFARALELLGEVRVGGAEPQLALRAYLAESWARMHQGDLHGAETLLERARSLAESPAFTDVSRADVLFHLACTRLKRGSVANAAALLTVALDLADRSGEPCDRLRAYVLERRARCYQRQRDWEAARCDIERALELAERLGEPRTLAHVYFQASIVAEREQQWLIARFYAEQAHGLYEQLGDVAAAAKTLNNLGGLAFLLGEPEAAQSFLSDAFRSSIASGDEANAGYALSSLAQVHLRVGEPELAEQRARRALQLLASRGDHQAELGSAQLVLGRALMELGRLEESGSAFLQAEVSLTSVSASHRASAWMALGELESRRGAHEVATSFYRRAAEALQDIHF